MNYKVGDILLMESHYIKRLVLVVYIIKNSIYKFCAHDLAGYESSCNDVEWNPTEDFKKTLIKREDLVLYTPYPVKTSLYFDLLSNPDNSIKVYQKRYPKPDFKRWEV